MKKTLIAVAALVAVIAFPAIAGEWHSGENNLCTDCHTMHFSQSHNWDGTTPVSTTPQPNGNWLSATGPNAFLLKAPANQLCMSCHDGQTFAPDVVGANFNASPTNGRSAGAINDVALGAPYDTWKGHTLDSTATPPGFDPTKIGASATWYDPAGGLECISCHAQHGPVTAYRNLGPYALGGAATAARPTYVIATTNDTTKDVWINIAAPYTAGSGSAATFNSYYADANVSFNRNDATVGTNKTSNRMDTFCGACHGNFHGGPADTNIGATVAALDGFVRHPTSQVTIGAAGAQGFGGHSALSRYTGATTKVNVYASDRVGYTDATPGCVTCHKAHGNQNPFGLVFLDRNATSVGEEGGFGADDTDTSVKTGYRNLCGQCHSQGD
ncbi:MAG TPA: cytochrome c3 family protein [Thermoanaerobaculia bacterium]|nr:cytochrome c3 family protein [Thermoanaerobaculia bacterium]